MEINKTAVLTKINDIEKLPTCIFKNNVAFFLIMDCNPEGKFRIGYKNLCDPDKPLISVCVDSKKPEDAFEQIIKIEGIYFCQTLFTTSTLESAVNILYDFIMTVIK